jgi:hypothetical protein
MAIAFITVQLMVSVHVVMIIASELKSYHNVCLSRCFH